MDTEEKVTLGALILAGVWEVGKLAIYAYILIVTLALAQRAMEALDNYNGQYVEETAPACVVEV